VQARHRSIDARGKSGPVSPNVIEGASTARRFETGVGVLQTAAG